MGGQKVCWKLKGAHSSAETTLFWVSAESFDRLQREHKKRSPQSLVITA